MKKINWTIVIGLLFLAGWFYWSQWRPTQIRKNCYSQARSYATSIRDKEAQGENEYLRKKAQDLIEQRTVDAEVQDRHYEDCLKLNGL